MIDYITTTSFQSKVLPEVSYKIRKISHKRRMEMMFRTAEHLSTLNDLQSQLLPIQEDIKQAEDAAKLEPCTCSHDPIIQEKETDPPQHDPKSGRCIKSGCDCRKPKPDDSMGGYTKYWDIIGKILDLKIFKLYPEYIRICTSDFQGLKIDGVPATVDSFLSDAPYELVKELGDYIEGAMGLSAQELVNFGLPTTSAGQGDGETLNTPAKSANETDSIKTAGAPGISQS